MVASNPRKVYLDYAAATPLDSDVFAAMKPYFSEKFYNPSAIYSDAKDVRQAVDSARQTITKNLSVKKNELIFTAGGTEANNLAILGIYEQFLPNSHFIVSGVEHDSVTAPVEYLKKKGLRVTYISPDTNGIINPDKVAKAINPDTVLVSIIFANNEIGTIQPINDIAKKLQLERKNRLKTKNKSPMYFHTDAAQATNYLNIHPKRLGVDLMTINGSKIYGPKQIGALYVRAGVKIAPLIHGGGQERGKRSGTENVPYIIGLAKAVEKAVENRKEESERLVGLQKYFIDSVHKNISSAVLNGSLKKRLPNNIHFTFKGYDNERLLFELDEQGIYAARGSACSEASEESSHVLKALGLTDDDARSSVRFSLGRQTTKQDIKYTLQILNQLFAN